MGQLNWPAGGGPSLPALHVCSSCIEDLILITSGSWLSVILDIGFYGSGTGLLSRRWHFLFLAAFHALLETFHRTAKITAEVAQLLGAEYQNNDQQNDQPMPDT